MYKSGVCFYVQVSRIHFLLKDGILQEVLMMIQKNGEIMMVMLMKCLSGLDGSLPRVRTKPKSSGLTQEPTRKKVPGSGTWFKQISSYWYLIMYPVLTFINIPG